MTTTNSIIVQYISPVIANIILNKPDIHNAFDDKLIASLTSALQACEQDSAVRVVLLSAKGKSFSAGADINWMQRIASYSETENHHDAMQLAKLMQTLHQLSKPTIALVNGAAYGGGVGLIACCDIAIAVDTAHFCFSEVKMGLIPAVISPYIVTALGTKIANRLFITAENFSADLARQWGLIDIVTTPADLLPQGLAYANMILKNSPAAILQTKQLMQLIHHHPINDSLMTETAKRIASCRVSEEGQAGLQAFLTKQDPPWC